MKELKGISASPGIIVGKAFLYSDDKPQIPRYSIDASRVEEELARFRDAAKSSVADVEALKARTKDEVGDEGNQVLDAHLLMLADPEFIGQVEDRLKAELCNAEWAMYEVVGTLVKRLEESTDSYLRERTIDIYDVAKRVLDHLLRRERITLADLTEEVVVVAHNLLPSDTLAMNKRMVKAIAMDGGGKTSHTAILARSFEIAAVLGLSQITQHVATGDLIVVDGGTGTVIVNPDPATLEHYERSSREMRERERGLRSLAALRAETCDGRLVQLLANIEVPEETQAVLDHGADGIGLYRSEFLYLKPGGFPSEQEQYAAYSMVLTSMSGKPVTIRTLDLGGDKVMPELKIHGDPNPILGWRAVRFCLSRVDVFKTQLRALYRASTHGDLRIMFPMISGIEELERVQAVVEEVKEELRAKNAPFNPDVPVGIMIEIPSAALTADILATRSRFFSIGTNDLIQYTIAVDRGNERIAYLYEPFHPGVLRLIRQTIEHAHAAKLPVSMCGEMAGDPFATVILLGLGLDSFSMSAARIPAVKRIIRSVSMSEARELATEAMSRATFVEIDALVKDWMHERFEVVGD